MSQIRGRVRDIDIINTFIHKVIKIYAKERKNERERLQVHMSRERHNYYLDLTD